MRNCSHVVFENGKNVDAIKIKDYIEWMAGSIKEDNLYEQVIQLPPIQRGFVWKPIQIQNLWDSLIRQIPIGSIMLQKFEAGVKSVQAGTNRKVSCSEKPGYFLMDGQQRSLAMLLGFPNALSSNHRLWIDFDEEGKNGCVFQFRVTTRSQPFGYAPNGGKLSFSDRREARRFWLEGARKPLDSSVDNAGTFADDLCENYNESQITEENLFDMMKPWKASDKCSRYIFEVKDLWEKIENENEWRERHFPEFDKFNQNIQDKINDFHKGFVALHTQWMALILIPELTLKQTIKDPAHDPLTMLFERISSGGTRLSSDDLLFSMIKQAWPEAHNLVMEIQENVGSLMKPTDYILTAFRLAALFVKDVEKKIGDEPRPDARYFHKNLYVLLGTESSPGVLRDFITGQNVYFKSSFPLLMETIKYQGINDHGIPKAMFPYFDVALIQTILFWIMQNQNDKSCIAKSRNEMIKFILFWTLSCRDKETGRLASKKAIEYLSEKNFEKFPSYELYVKLIKKNEQNYSLFIPLVPINRLSLVDESIELKHPSKRSKKYFYENDEDTILAHTNLYDKFSRNKYLLLWLQRDYLTEKFSKFSPLAGQDEDSVPYDFDHLVPQSNWASKAGLCRKEIKNLENTKHFENIWVRRSLGNAIGNYRIFSASENRGRGDQSLESVLKNKCTELEDSWQSYCFNPSTDKELQWWKDASPEDNKNVWNDKRIQSFQAAIESRTLYLYNLYMNDSKLSEWFLLP